MRKGDLRAGFTMIELSLSLTFIAVLSIAVVVIMMNAVSAYHRGIILNQINTTGMELVDDMRASIQNSSAHSAISECASVYSKDDEVEDCKRDNAKKFIIMSKTASVKIGSKTVNAPVFGAFCTGNYSYLWNSGYFYGESGATVDANVARATLKYKSASESGTSTKSVSEFKLLKVLDENRSICKFAAGDRYSGSNSTYSSNFDISTEGYPAVEEEPVELLTKTSGLVLYDLASATPAEIRNPDSMFYSVSFILGTIQGGINVMSSGDFCTPPGDLANGGIENFNYCAINKFNFAAEANGG